MMSLFVYFPGMARIRADVALPVEQVPGAHDVAERLVGGVGRAAAQGERRALRRGRARRARRLRRAAQLAQRDY